MKEDVRDSLLEETAEDILRLLRHRSAAVYRLAQQGRGLSFQASAGFAPESENASSVATQLSEPSTETKSQTKKAALCERLCDWLGGGALLARFSSALFHQFV